MNTAHLKSSLPRPRRHGLFIVGMHRSGTSALAGLLARLGGVLPAHMMPPGPDNPGGYFESQAIYLLNEQLLVHLDSGWDDLRAFPEDWLESAEANPWIEGLAEAVRLEFAGQGWLVLKDPRLIWMFPVWKRVVQHLQMTASWIVAVREPVLAADSLSRSEGIHPARSLALWLHNLTTAERMTRHERRAFVAFEELLWCPRGAITRLETSLAIDLIPPSGWRDEITNGFLTPAALRAAPMASGAARDAGLAGWLASAHRWALAVLRFENPPKVVMDRISAGLRVAVEDGRFGDPRGVHARRRSSRPALHTCPETGPSH